MDVSPDRTINIFVVPKNVDRQFFVVYQRRLTVYKTLNLLSIR